MNATVMTRPSPWTAHRVILASLALACAALTVLVWFHPTAGYADENSIISGADLRASLLLILWSGVAVFATISSLIIALTTPFTSRRLIQLIAGYLVALASMPLYGVIIDKFV